MEAASNEGEHFAQLSYNRFLRKVGQQSYVLKQPRDHEKPGSDTRQRMVYTDISPGALWEECTKIFNPQVINRTTIIIMNVEKWSRWCVSYSSGPQHEAHPLTGLTAPSSLLAESAAHTVSSTFCTYYRALHNVYS